MLLKYHDFPVKKQRRTMSRRLVAACLIFMVRVQFFEAHPSDNHQQLAEDQSTDRTDSLVKLKAWLTDVLMKSDYNPSIPPVDGPEDPVVVSVGLDIQSIDLVADPKMDYTMNFFFHQKWTDKRLAFRKHSNISKLELDNKLTSRVWVPNTFFRNLKSARFHDVPVPNKLMHLYPDGSIIYRTRITAILFCKMDLRRYPLDRQKCPIIIESFGQSSSIIVYRWRKKNAVYFYHALHIKSFTLTGYTLSDCTTAYLETGTFSCVQANFEMARDVGFHVLQYYVPSTLVVILSWLSFWLDVEAIPGRITLGVLTVLTIGDQSSASEANLPHSDHVKALNVWLSSCQLFVFAGVVEFAVVNVLSRRREPQPHSLGSVHPRRGSSLSRMNEVLRLPHSVGAEGEGYNSNLDDWSPVFADYGYRQAKRLDRLSRVGFPVAFALFNVVYWTFYLSDE